MSNDSINDEILGIKRELAARFDNDLDRIAEDTKSRERNAITLPPRPYPPVAVDSLDLPTPKVLDGDTTSTTG